jgi:hypothetical protein
MWCNGRVSVAAGTCLNLAAWSALHAVSGRAFVLLFFFFSCLGWGFCGLCFHLVVLWAVMQSARLSACQACCCSGSAAVVLLLPLLRPRPANWRSLLSVPTSSIAAPGPGA